MNAKVFGVSFAGIVAIALVVWMGMGTEVESISKF